MSWSKYPSTLNRRPSGSHGLPLFFLKSFAGMIFHMQGNVISKNLLQKFMRRNRLFGVVAFLHFIRRKSSLQEFYDFCSQYGQILPKPPRGNVLFHGSSTVRQVLQPNTSMGHGGKRERCSYVYATDDPNYAVFLAVLDLRNGSASVTATARNTVLVVNLDFVNGPSKLKNGYVHVLAGEGFRKTQNREYRTNRPTNILFAIPVNAADLAIPIYIQTE